MDSNLADEKNEGVHQRGAEHSGASVANWRAAGFMLANPLAVSESESVLKVCERMARERVGQVLVVAGVWEPGAETLGDPPEPLGIFTERDLIRAFVQHQGGVLAMRVGELMTTPVVCVSPDEDITHAADLMTLMRIRRLPVVAAGRTVGLLTRGRVMDAQSRRLAEMTHQNEVLLERVVHDALTGLANRVLFDRILERELAGKRERGGVVSILELDIDHFKRVNDTYGHPVGDIVLGQLAEILRAVLRRADLAARVGGEEFAVVLSKGGDSPAFVAEKLRLAVEQGTFGENNQPLPITISVGCAEAKPGENAAALFKRVDQALYEAKNTGRNKVVTAA